MQSRNMAAGAVTILLALLIHRAEADEFTLADALQSNGSRCGENGKLYPSEFSVPEMYWQAFGAPCSCDPLCAPYKDCCQNSEHFAAEDQVWGSSPQSCFNVSERDPYFSMKKSCPASWDDDETRSKCQGHPDFPLTSSWTLVTYLNMYCAECNRDFHPDTDTLWPAEYRCHGDGAFRYEVRVDSGENDTTDVNISTWNLTHSDNFHYRYPVNAFVFLHSYFVPEDLTLYDPRSRPNFLKTEDENPPKEHNKHTRVHPGDYRCDRFFSVLNRSIMRICPQVISTCASDWTESDVEGKCLAYTDIYCNKKYLYRNPYCAHCNRVNLKHKFSCFLMESASSRANFSWLQKWNSNKYDVFPLENHTSIQDADEEDKRNSILNYISLFGLSVSVACLVLHLAISSGTPRLRNLPAMNLASLCVALLLFYFILLVRIALDGIPHVGLDIAMHCSLLATFSWMLVISFDVWNAIRRSTKKLQLSSGMKWKRFAVYSVFGWVEPVLITMITVLSVSIIKRYSNFLRNSWFSNPLVSHVLVSAPFCVFMTLNIAFFIWSACLVYSTKSKMESRSTARTQLCLFVRLFVIMGLTWAGDLVATIFRIQGNVCTYAHPGLIISYLRTWNNIIVMCSEITTQCSWVFT
ncbi:uncharacterized protein LOC111868619 [Cryptotermes secundus]|uniref:uncharacterized protein LOC111868619 n=1 Tax=Cryptotermes secundus TaxID=105785 RepID=UPI001454CE46|nr:uncharacterized protein LOC111868619 [Cryptotermes secundus]